MRKLFIGIIIAGIIGISGLFIGTTIAMNTNKRVVTATVVDKAIKHTSNRSKYLIFTEDDGVFEITDTPFYGRWNSSDVYGDIYEGQTYNFTVVGTRNHFLSLYPNILDVQQIVPIT